MIQTTLIIPTLNRSFDLHRCLNSITKLTKDFDEIIIIEQGDIEKTKKIVDEFNMLNIKIYSQHIKSLTQARNLGIDKAQGKFIFFVDDDTKLDKNYIQVALDYFAKNSQVMGITGKIEDSKKTLIRFIKRLLTTLIGLNSFKNKILKSGHNSASFYNKEQTAQWLSGCHAVYRQTVFADGFRFNKDFIYWSFGEDVMFSYQVYKYYGEGSLMFIPAFKLKHYESKEIRISNEATIKMIVIYRFIFWKKEVYQGFKFNLIYYLYSQLSIIFFGIKQAKYKLKTLNFFICSYQYLIKNKDKIIKNEIDYNAFIIDNIN